MRQKFVLTSRFVPILCDPIARLLPDGLQLPTSNASHSTMMGVSRPGSNLTSTKRNTPLRHAEEPYITNTASRDGSDSRDRHRSTATPLAKSSFGSDYLGMISRKGRGGRIESGVSLPRPESTQSSTDGRGRGGSHNRRRDLSRHGDRLEGPRATRRTDPDVFLEDAEGCNADTRSSGSVGSSGDSVRGGRKVRAWNRSLMYVRIPQC